MPSLRNPVPGNWEVRGWCFTIVLPWLSWLCCRGVREPWLPWARHRALPWWESSAQPDLLLASPERQPESALCPVSWHCTLAVSLVPAVNCQAQQSQMSSHHSEVATGVWFCSPLSPFLLSFNLLLSFFLCVVPCAACLPLSPVCYVPVFPFLSSPFLLLPCRALIVFPFTLPFVEPSHLLCSFLFPSPAPLWRSLPGSLRVACVPLHFREQL